MYKARNILKGHEQSATLVKMDADNFRGGCNMRIIPENNQNKKENKNNELKVNGYIGGCGSDCHVYYESTNASNGCGWDWTSYRNIFS